MLWRKPVAASRRARIVQYNTACWNLGSRRGMSISSGTIRSQVPLMIVSRAGPASVAAMMPPDSSRWLSSPCAGSGTISMPNKWPSMRAVRRSMLLSCARMAACSRLISSRIWACSRPISSRIWACSLLITARMAASSNCISAASAANARTTVQITVIVCRHSFIVLRCARVDLSITKIPFSQQAARLGHADICAKPPETRQFRQVRRLRIRILIQGSIEHGESAAKRVSRRFTTVGESQGIAGMASSALVQRHVLTNRSSRCGDRSLQAPQERRDGIVRCGGG